MKQTVLQNGPDETLQQPPRQSRPTFTVIGVNGKVRRRTSNVNAIFPPRPKARRGFTFINSNCECWRTPAGVFCSKCSPVMLAEVPIAKTA